MATFTDGPVSIRYDDVGSGPPVLLLAPGGLRNSRADYWSAAPWNPIDALAPNHRVIAMDQRNTGTSTGPVRAGDGWHTYAADQLALMDHLGIDRFAVVGMCIGGAFILELLTTAPERVGAAVAMQPIGQQDNRDAFRGIFDTWRADLAAEHPEADDAAWESVFRDLFGGDQLLWSVPDDALGSIETPLLVLRGDDPYHPSVASERLAASAPHATLIHDWKPEEHQPAARRAVDEFLAAHAA